MQHTERKIQDYWNDILRAMDACWRDHDYEVALQIGQEFVKNTAGDESDEGINCRSQCLTKLADTLYALKRYEDCLEVYERALKVAGARIDQCSDEALEVWFKLERALNARAMLDKIGAGKAELKHALVSQYLMQTKDAAEHGAAVSQEVESELLEQLWSVALERKEFDQAAMEGREEKQGLLAKLLGSKQFEAVFIQCGIWCAGLMAIYIVVQGVMLCLSSDMGRISSSEPGALREAYLDNQTNNGTAGLLLGSADGQQRIELQVNKDACWSLPKGQLTGPVIFYDGSPLAAMSTIVGSGVLPSVVFHSRGCLIVSENGSVFFNKQANDFKLSQEVNRMASRLENQLKSHHTLPDSHSSLLSYEYPENKHSRRAIISQASQLPTLLNKQMSPGSILLLRRAEEPDVFSLVGCDDNGKCWPAARTNEGWRSLFPVGALSAPPVGGKVLFVFCERQMDPLTDLLRNKLAVIVTLSVVAVLVVILVAKSVLPLAYKMALGIVGAKVRVRAPKR